MSGRPLPVPDESSASFWAAAATHVLTVARCAQCSRYSMPPDVICPQCHAPDPCFTFIPVSGRGCIRSWTVVRQAFLPGFDSDLAFILVDVQLVEQTELRLIGRLLNGAVADLHSGDAVVACFEDIAPGVAIPAFELMR